MEGSLSGAADFQLLATVILDATGNTSEGMTVLSENVASGVALNLEVDEASIDVSVCV